MKDVGSNPMLELLIGTGGMARARAWEADTGSSVGIAV
jgi:hypothetical protein